MEHAKRTPCMDSSMQNWQGSRGGYRKNRGGRNGRYGDNSSGCEFSSRTPVAGKRDPGGSHGIMRD